MGKKGQTCILVMLMWRKLGRSNLSMWAAWSLEERMSGFEQTFFSQSACDLTSGRYLFLLLLDQLRQFYSTVLNNLYKLLQPLYLIKAFISTGSKNYIFKDLLYHFSHNGRWPFHRSQVCMGSDLAHIMLRGMWLTCTTHCVNIVLFIFVGRLAPMSSFLLLVFSHWLTKLQAFVYFWKHWLLDGKNTCSSITKWIFYHVKLKTEVRYSTDGGGDSRMC